MLHNVTTIYISRNNKEEHYNILFYFYKLPALVHSLIEYEGSTHLPSQKFIRDGTHNLNRLDPSPLNGWKFCHAPPLNCVRKIHWQCHETMPQKLGKPLAEKKQMKAQGTLITELYMIQMVPYILFKKTLPPTPHQ